MLKGDLISYLQELAGGPRLPDDSLFLEGNKNLIYLKRYGIYQTDSEDFLHKPVATFNCEVFGCKEKFDTVFLFDQHYNSYHRYTCRECKKTLASPHLLDLHVSETHDSFFAVQAERKPMYACYLEECKEVFLTAELRNEHGILQHRIPPSFWKFTKQHKSKKKVTTKKNENSNEVEMEDGEDNEMDIDSTKTKPVYKPKILGIRGTKVKREKMFETFSKDLADSLPD